MCPWGHCPKCVSERKVALRIFSERDVIVSKWSILRGWLVKNNWNCVRNEWYEIFLARRAEGWCDRVWGPRIVRSSGRLFVLCCDRLLRRLRIWNQRTKRNTQITWTRWCKNQKKLERVPDLIRHASPESLRAKKITKANNVGTGIDFFPSRAEETWTKKCLDICQHTRNFEILLKGNQQLLKENQQLIWKAC